jgi:phage shock protein A
MKTFEEARAWVITTMTGVLFGTLAWVATEMKTDFKDTVGGIKAELTQLNSNVTSLTRSVDSASNKILSIEEIQRDHENRLRQIESKRRH